MQNANETANQLQAAAQTEAQTAITTAPATSTTTPAASPTATDTAAAIDPKATADVKEKRELSKKEMPLPKNPGYEWIIKSGDLDALDKTIGEVVVYEKKLLEEANNTAAAKPAASANDTAMPVPKDKKDVKETQENKVMLSHVAIGHFKTQSYDPVKKQWYPCKKKNKYLNTTTDLSANCIMLFFKGATEKAVNDFNNEIINDLAHTRAITPMFVGGLEPMGPPENPTPYKCYVVSHHSQQVVQKLFQFLLQKLAGLLSQADIDYFMKISGYRAIPHYEKEGMSKISKAMISRDYNAVLAELKTLQEASIQESRDLGIFLGADEDSEQSIYFDPCRAAYETGKQLLPLSPSYAFKAFALLTEGSPYYTERLSVAISFAEVRLAPKALTPAERQETIHFLLHSMNKSSLGHEGVGKAFNLLFELLEIHSGNEKNFLQRITDLKALTDLMPIFTDNILSISNRLYELKSGTTLRQSKKEEDDKASNNKSSLQITKPNESSSSNTAASTSSVPTIAAAKDSASISIATATGGGTGLAKDSKSSHDNKNTASASSTTTMPALPPDWTMFPFCDRQKFIEDTSHEERIIFIRESSPSHDSKQHCESTFSFSKLMIVRLKESYCDEEGQQRKEKGEPIVNLILLTEDLTMAQHTITSLPQDVIHHFLKQNRNLRILRYFDSSDDFILNNNRFMSNLPYKIGGTRVLGLRIGAMRQDLADSLFDSLKTFLGEDLCHFIQELILPLTKPVTPEETALREKIKQTMSQVDVLNRLIREDQTSKNHQQTKPEQLTQKRNAALDSIIMDAKIIHDKVRSENQAQEYLTSYEQNIYPMEDIDLAIELGKAFSLVSPEHAYRVLELVGPGSVYFDEAQALMAPIALDFAVSADTTEKQRYYREKLLRHLLKENGDFEMFLQFLEVHAGYEGPECLGSNSIFSAIKGKPMSLDLMAQTFIILCERLSEWKQKASKNTVLDSSTATHSKEMTTAYHTALAAGGSLVVSSPVATASAANTNAAIHPIATANPSTMTFSTTGTTAAHSAAVSQSKPNNLSTSAASSTSTAASLEQTTETAGKRIKSLEESDDDEADATSIISPI